VRFLVNNTRLEIEHIEEKITQSVKRKWTAERGVNSARRKKTNFKKKRTRHGAPE